VSTMRRELAGRLRLPAAAVVALVLAAAPSVAGAQGAAAPGGTPVAAVRVVTDPAGSRLQVDGRDFMVFGMNWDYIPIGENYAYDLWRQPDELIEAALAREMPLLRGMGVNVIRQYAGIPPRWVRYIHERYGIYTVLNHPVARYGYTLDGTWIPSVDYSDPRLRAAVKAEVLALVDEFRGVPGVLMWLLGNENNYGLSWSSFEIEALPEGERDAARARHLYSLYGEIIAAIKARDDRRVVAIANGDVQYIDIIAQECRGLDVFGTNVYRGISARDLFQVVREKLGTPVLFTEFGADAWNTREMREDQVAQARYLIGQWREIYEQSSGKGQVGNAIGGIVFQWSDGWWKYGQESRLDVHDTHASWPNGGYVEDFVEGDNNMNEEWWGITAKGPPDSRGLYELYPRAAYYALQRAFRLDPYAPATDRAAIAAHFAAIDPAVARLEARGDGASLAAGELSRVRLKGARLQFETISTGGARISTPSSGAPTAPPPAFLGFDQMQSFYAELEARPADNATGTLSLNVLGHVPANPINEIFYEKRGRPRIVQGEAGPFTLDGIERVKVYAGSISWEERAFQLEAFYRTGHYHWGYEGDFFGLYREANYGESIDIYNADAPVGFELTGRRSLDGLKLAFGPQLWWGANPAALAKYRRRVGPVNVTGIYNEDLTSQSTITSSIAVPTPPTRRATLHLETRRGPWGLEVGGIWSGSTKKDETFQVAEPSGSTYRILLDRVLASDALGAKARLTMQKGRWNWYAQAARMGLVADGGPTAILTYTGWSLKDVGTGNQTNAMTGVAVNVGRFQIAPNVLWQKPIIGPIPRDVPSPGLPRNVLDDPFAVRSNRETLGAELMIGYDPTPGTWMWAWDNDVREDARLAASLDLVFRHLPTTQDAAIGILSDGTTTFAFPGAPPPRDLWEVRGRVVSRTGADTRVVGTLYAGTAQPNGLEADGSARLIHRYGLDARIAHKTMAFATYLRIRDWGPYDYHRDFNLTFPLQVMGDLSHSLGVPRWFGRAQTRLGVRATWRSLDRHSPRYWPATVLDGGGNPQPDLSVRAPNGREWEIRSYVHLAL
jgi:hypothetical protein